jgi:hypothetical protein
MSVSGGRTNADARRSALAGEITQNNPNELELRVIKGIDRLG